MLARFYPGLPDLMDLTPLDIVAYLRWRHDALTARPDEDDEGDVDFDA